MLHAQWISYLNNVELAYEASSTLDISLIAVKDCY